MKNGFKRICIIGALALVTACGTSYRAQRQEVGKAKVEAPATWLVAERVWRYSTTHPDGFTLNVSTMEVPSEGICVAYSATQDCHSRDGLDYVVSHSLQHEGYVGGWLDKADSLYYFDSVKIFPEAEREKALDFARQNGQIAVFVLSSGEEIRLVETPEQE